jgi:hypothetical protein
MRWIAVAGVVATAVILGVVAYAGHLALAWPSWLVILVAMRLLHGRRRAPHMGGSHWGRHTS